MHAVGNFDSRTVVRTHSKNRRQEVASGTANDRFPTLVGAGTQQICFLYSEHAQLRRQVVPGDGQCNTDLEKTTALDWAARVHGSEASVHGRRVHGSLRRVAVLVVSNHRHAKNEPRPRFHRSNL